MYARVLAGYLAGCIIAVAPLRADWSQVIDFNNLNVDPQSENWVGNVVKVTRDEGYEAGRTEGFAAHHLRPDGAGGQMYYLATGGHGYSWGHVFAAIDLEQDIVDKGTLYFQMAMAGISNDFNFSLASDRPFRVDPPATENPWGWDGPKDWGDMIVGTLSWETHIMVRDSAAFRTTQTPWALGEWYEMWWLLDVPNEIYSIYVRGGGGQVPEQTVQVVEFEGEEFDNYFFASTTDALRSILIGQTAWSPGEPSLNHEWFINNIAIDFEAHNLTDPPVPAPGPGIGVAPQVKWGFTVLAGSEWALDGRRFLGMFHGESAPWIYSFDLQTWAYVFLLADAEGNPRSLDDNRAFDRFTWAYVLNSGAPAGPPVDHIVQTENYLGRIHVQHAPWVYSFDIGTWFYLAEGDWNSNAAWVFVLNPD